MRIQHLVDNYSSDELAFAAHTSLYADGKRDMATAPNAPLYPPYGSLVEAKKLCYPAEESIFVTESTAAIRLQDLVDHTTRRLADTQREVILNHLDHLTQGLTLTFKWGCDGSSGYSLYKQKFEDEEYASDFYLFSICCVPLRLESGDKTLIVWNNPSPSSTRFCRPLKLIFKKEDAEFIRKEVTSIQNEISALTPTTITVNARDIVVSHCFSLTILTFSAVTETSSQRCGICNATPSQMNDLANIYNKSPDESKYEYGVSSLHSYIRTFECLLHIAYRQDLKEKKWRVTSLDDKTVVKATKSRIQERFKKEMGLLIDVKPGYGTTNDGNTADRFFRDPTLSSSITGIDVDLIKDLGAILECISSGYAINIEKFEIFTRATVTLWLVPYAVHIA
ncbi:unnamed protein product [Euphydryas editha]|nr:unnamed protein product [Euphydryas editha]